MPVDANCVVAPVSSVEDTHRLEQIEYQASTSFLVPISAADPVVDRSFQNRLNACRGLLTPDRIESIAPGPVLVQSLSLRATR